MIGLLGLNHKTAPISVREKFVFCEEDIKRFVPQALERGAKGVIVVSTCNRTKLYFDCSGQHTEEVGCEIEEMLFEWQRCSSLI